MRIVLAAGFALALMACGEKPAPESTAASAPEVAAPAAVKSADAVAWAAHVPWKSDGADVKKTGSGMEYIVLASGPADGVPPTAQQEVEVYYEGRFNAGGPAFDSAFERNQSATFSVSRVVPGFSEALQLMKPGDRWLVFIPSALGYGPEGRAPRIPPDTDLVFEIEMIGAR
jgi:FKBP-type peptidyl-prolyl cis-trans isomerase